MRGFARLTISATLAAALAVFAAPASAKPKIAGSSKPSDFRGQAYIEQVDAPAEWQTEDAFWIEADSLVLDTLLNPDRSDRLVIADPGNSASQVQDGPDQIEFAFQWGRGNSVAQRQSGSDNLLEAVQISPGATLGRRANAGKGNGPEYDLFGFEVDPGNSGAHNRSPEQGDSSGGGAAAGHEAIQQQAGSGNFARVVQIGSAHEARQDQTGSDNASVIVQFGRDNHAASEQTGDGNASVVSQSGSGNKALVRQ